MGPSHNVVTDKPPISREFQDVPVLVIPPAGPDNVQEREQHTHDVTV